MVILLLFKLVELKPAQVQFKAHIQTMFSEIESGGYHFKGGFILKRRRFCI